MKHGLVPSRQVMPRHRLGTRVAHVMTHLCGVIVWVSYGYPRQNFNHNNQEIINSREQHP